MRAFLRACVRASVLAWCVTVCVCTSVITRHEAVQQSGCFRQLYAARRLQQVLVRPGRHDDGVSVWNRLQPDRVQVCQRPGPRLL